MTTDELRRHVLALSDRDIPLPGGGQTPQRHRALFQIAREGLTVARLVEAHWDALAILAEAGRRPAVGQLYGVWASERMGQPISFARSDESFVLSGGKGFCSGAGIVDRALVTALFPEPRLVDVDLRANATHIEYDLSSWKSSAFHATNTATVSFNEIGFSEHDFIGGPDWYLSRPGFWHGACGPAACWAGGAAGLLDYALQQSRSDAHTIAHQGAMYADIWAAEAYLDVAGREIDAQPAEIPRSITRALILRHLVEQASTDILHRLTRAFGPHPLVADAVVSQQYNELHIYLRQSHAERDLEALGKLVRS